MKIIIIILQAILNLVRKRRDLIANIDKIPPAIKKSIIVGIVLKNKNLIIMILLKVMQRILQDGELIIQALLLLKRK